ncbi:hypothetical protein IW261DRAFT_1514941, partial [Armillaria novae-zelandiae]
MGITLTLTRYAHLAWMITLTCKTPILCVHLFSNLLLSAIHTSSARRKEKSLVVSPRVYYNIELRDEGELRRMVPICEPRLFLRVALTFHPKVVLFSPQSAIQLASFHRKFLRAVPALREC